MNPNRLDNDGILEFIDGQADWALLESNHEKLDEAVARGCDFYLNDSLWAVSVYHVDYRRASASADVDKAMAGERPCFLCKPNRPKQQRIIDWEGYEILANPYPLDALHLTIAAKEHTPQRIEGHILDMARLCRILSDSMVFYNGPRCGASAPDHLHFQAVDKGMADNFELHLPYTATIYKVGKSILVGAAPGTAPYFFFHIVSAKDAELKQLLGKLRPLLINADPEPMVNVMVWKSRRGTNVVIVPRKAHRPTCYGEGEGQMLISPASLEMAGYFNCARAEDAERLDDGKIREIYSEVAYEPMDYWEKLEQSLS